MESLAVQRPFDLDDEAAYARWRDRKWAMRPRDVEELIVEVQDPYHLRTSERQALVGLCQRANMAIYRTPVLVQDTKLPRQLGAQLGLQRLDANWLADSDGVSPIAVAQANGQRSGFIPYTNRAIKWHTDGYYHPPSRTIRAMLLHCVRSASVGGDTAVMDHELAYIALRQANVQWVRALMAPDAMTIPARLDEKGVARPAQSGPVFSVDPVDGALHMRYTARTRSVQWKDDPLTQEAGGYLLQLLDRSEDVFRLRLSPGMGLVCNNVLHDRSEFVDDPNNPRLLYRARYLDRVASS